jgi:hypothetical protein
MVQELADRVDSLPAGWATRHNNAASTLRNRWRLIYEIGKIVALNFLLDCSKQNGFLHVQTPDDVQRKGAPLYR